MNSVTKYIKQNLKYIVPVVVLIVVIVASILNIKVYKPNTKLTTDNFNAVDYKDYSGSITIDGTCDDFTYQWYYSKDMLTDCKSTDLHLISTKEYNSIVEDALPNGYYSVYKFSENLNLNGIPTLTIYIPKKDISNLRLYTIDTTNNSINEVKTACNSTKDGYSITYSVNDTNSIYVVYADYQTQTDTTTIDTTSTTTTTTISTTSKDTTQTTTVTENSTTTNTGSNTTQDTTIATTTEPQTLDTTTQPTQDDYLTDPIPEGQPLPVEPEEVTIEYQDYYTCYLTIVCNTILDNMDELSEDKISYVPEDGTIYPRQEVIFYEGESVYDLLARETEKYGIQMEITFTPMYNSVYVEGINNLYEFDCGSLSGWTYSVNGWFPNYGCSRYSLLQGDEVIFSYTCNLGEDVGNTSDSIQSSIE